MFNKITFNMAIKNELLICFLSMILLVSCTQNEDEDSYGEYFVETSNTSSPKDSATKVVSILHEEPVGVFPPELKIQEDSCWSHALNSNSVEYYENYLVLFPEGKYTLKAKQTIQKLSANTSKSETESNFITDFKISNKNEGFKGTYLKFFDSRDGNVYNVVKIGEIFWFAENLKYKPKEGRYWAFNNNPNSVPVYGYLYDWETAYSVCPKGWMLPEDKDWLELQNSLNRRNEVASVLKSANNWKKSSFPANNNSGFSAIPAGIRTESGDFVSQNTVTFWWTSTALNENQSYYRNITSSNNVLYRNYDSNDAGYSVRCIRYVK